jgi:hypothetical protein
MRPKASEENKAIALAFAQCVTAPSDDNGFVARHGNHSLFAAFERVFPDLIRNANDPRPANRHGVSEPEFNKLLERGDSDLFIRKRNRLISVRKASSAKPSSLSAAGSWMFARSEKLVNIFSSGLLRPLARP